MRLVKALPETAIAGWHLVEFLGFDDLIGEHRLNFHRLTEITHLGAPYEAIAPLGLTHAGNRN